MKELAREVKPSDIEHKCIYRSGRAAAIERVAKEHGIPFSRIAGPGETYTHADGEVDVLPEGLTFISLLFEPRKDMSSFWDKVDEIEPPFRPPNTSRKPIPAEAWE